MKKIQGFSLILCALILFISCSGNKNILSQNSPEEIKKSITLEVNEATRYHFELADSSWSGTKTRFGLSPGDEKIELERFTVIEDSSWMDFGSFIEYLQLFKLPPQHAIEGWAPNSAIMPKKVYRFEIFNGDSTRTFSYQDPEHYLFEFDHWQLIHVIIFTTLVEQELHWESN